MACLVVTYLKKKIKKLHQLHRNIPLLFTAVTNSVQILENAVNHCQESIGIASIAATSTLLARLHEILPLDASRSEIISPLLRTLSQMRAKNNSHHLIQQLLLHPDLANYFVDCNQVR